MRILHLIHSEGVYGAELILLYLAREQQQQGHEPFIGSMRDPGTPETPFEALAGSWGLTVVPIRILPRPTPAVIRTLLGISRSLQAAVLHSHGYKANILLGPLRRGKRPPMVSTLHGWTASRTLSFLWLYERLDRWALGHVDAVVVVTHAMLKLPALRAAAGKVHLIENGIPALATRMADLALSGAAEVPRSLVEFTRRRPTMVAIGRLSAEKGFASLIEAFGRANRAHGDAHQLLLVGEGSERAALAQRIAALGLQDHAWLAGYVAGADRLLETAAGFVMSSRTEGMLVVLMEALQWGVPIVATAVGAIPELLQDGRAGELVAPDDVGALTRALAALMARTAAAAVEPRAGLPGHFSSGRMARDYLRLYEAIT
jgi:glycosyltransferase involved in cell wall biosynthesis